MLFSHVLFSFSYFLYKKEVATPHHLPKKRSALKSTQKSLYFEMPNFPGLSQCVFLVFEREKTHREAGAI